MGNPRGVKRDFDALEKRRYQAQKLLESGIHKAEVARRLGVHRQSVTRWAKAVDDRGKAALAKAGRAGRLPRMSSTQKEELKTALLQGPESHGYSTGLWTVARVGALIQERTGIKYHPGHVWKLLRQLGWTPQRPVGRALERNEAAITEWKTKQWPAIKKKPVRKRAP
jgi:transposase